MAIPPGLVVAAVLPREDPRDALVLPRGAGVARVARRAAAIGTGSVRRDRAARRALPHARSSCRCAATSTRGCASSTPASSTRWSSPSPDSSASATAIAFPKPISHADCVPAPGQGIVAIETREDAADTRDALARAQRRDGCGRVRRRTRRRRGARRRLPAAARRDCRARQRRDSSMQAIVTSPDGSRVVRGGGTRRPEAARRARAAARRGNSPAGGAIEILKARYR